MKTKLNTKGFSKKVYSKDEVKAILDSLDTRFFFRSPSKLKEPTQSKNDEVNKHQSKVKS
ncbi:hypothetical protein L3V82_08310 [Thiotrichales bacterium 19S3-7]|nr:hypothetical protein [Thiotrichales bacterium 19S3-7]MCF6802258.1 hypothetical protein [Thiotrichales bacterium 19S3-11]